MTTPNDAKDIVAAAGGSLTGKTRLQKSAYFLEVCGVGAGFDFSYHYYGPYSEELATATTDAVALNLIEEDWNLSQGGFQYATLRTNLTSNEPDGPQAISRRDIMRILDRYDAVSLELAATAHFLADNGFEDDPWLETERRKAGKATPERLERAKALLNELGFAALA